MEKPKTNFEILKSKIIELKKKNINEAQTKEWLIKPFFQMLDWDFSDPNEVIPEDDDIAGKRCDYRFSIKGKPKLLIEAKPLNNSLDDTKMIMEKLNYCINSGITLLIITNGEIYRIYYSELKGIGNDKLLEEFILTEDFDEDMIDRLSKTAIEKNVLLSYAKNISLYTNIKKAIEKLFLSSNKSFIRIINNYVKENLGHKFGEDEIDEALRLFSLQINTDLEYLHLEEKESEEKEKESEEKNWTIEYQFKDGKWKSSFELYNKLISSLRNLGLKFDENPTKFYIGLISDKANFCQIHGQKSGLKAWLNLEVSDISEQASLNVRDVSNIGHWGMGNIECFIKNEMDLDWVSNLIKKAYEKK